MTQVDRLREQAQEIQDSIESIIGECENDPRPGWALDKAACVAGAKALEFVASIAAEPNEGGVCDYCGRKHWRDGHEATCRWQMARDLVEGKR